MKQRIGREIGLALIVGAVLALTHAGCLTPINPGPGPDPQPQPGPIKSDKLVVAVVYESSQPLSRSQQAIAYSAPLRQFVHSAGGEFRLLDKDADVSRADQWVKDAIAAERASMPWLIVASKKGGAGVPLPETVEAVQELVRKYQ